MIAILQIIENAYLQNPSQIERKHISLFHPNSCKAQSEFRKACHLVKCPIPPYKFPPTFQQPNIKGVDGGVGGDEVEMPIAATWVCFWVSAQDFSWRAIQSYCWNISEAGEEKWVIHFLFDSAAPWHQTTLQEFSLRHLKKMCHTVIPNFKVMLYVFLFFFLRGGHYILQWITTWNKSLFKPKSYFWISETFRGA